MKSFIYLDYNATSPLDLRVRTVMEPFFSEKFANSASAHIAGWIARDAVELARSEIAKNIGAPNGSSLVFTSGATEANNLALQGFFFAAENQIRIVSQLTEHSSVLEPLRRLTECGSEVDFVSVDKNGLVDLDALKEKIRKKTDLVSIMLAQNETGVLQPLREVIKICHEHSVLVHTDATQAIGKIPVNVFDLDVDMMSFSAHKMGGPKGVGVLYIAKRNPKIFLKPILYGGGHEGNLRSGTLDVPAIVGMNAALKMRTDELAVLRKKWKSLKKKMLTGLAQFLSFQINGDLENSLDNTINICIPGLQADQLIIQCPQIAFATGSACASGHAEASHVLLAMGLSREKAQASVRFSFGNSTSENDIEEAVSLIEKTIIKLAPHLITRQ